MNLIMQPRLIAEADTRSGWCMLLHVVFCESCRAFPLYCLHESVFAVLCREADAAGLSQVVLLKHLEKTTAELFKTHKLFEGARNTLGPEPENVR